MKEQQQTQIRREKAKETAEEKVSVEDEEKGSEDENEDGPLLDDASCHKKLRADERGEY